MRLFFCVSFLFMSLNVFSDEPRFNESEILKSMANTHPDFFIIDENSVEFKKIDNSTLEEMNIPPMYFEDPITNTYDNKSIVDSLGATVYKIINIGKKIWSVIVSGKPVINIKTDWASAVPEGTKDWVELHSWQTPRTVNYSYSAKNLYGINAVEIIYRVIYTYGGKYEEVGSYLTNVKVVPLHVNVLWGYDFEMFVEVPNILNVGTRKDPIGALELVVTTRISTVLKKLISAQTFFITGEGDFRDFN